MDQELETYNVQLSQVELALVSDPDNADLKSLQLELQELIALTEKASSSSSERKTPSSKSHLLSDKSTQQTQQQTLLFQSGDEVLAKYSGDNAWYPARVASVGGSDDRRAYTVVFKGYNSTEVVQSGSVKPLPVNYVAPSAVGKRKAEEQTDKDRKKKKNEKKAEARAVKAKEQNNKQASWLKFTKRSERRGVSIAGIDGKSIFKSPDNPYGRVGVTGSGQGMSESVQRQKHKYDVE